MSPHPFLTRKARIEIIPLIDIMFFLLASFMMVSLSQVHMKGINVNLPSGVSGETQTKREYVSVSVDKNGHYFFDKEEMSSDEQLLNLLRNGASIGSGREGLCSRRQGFGPPERCPRARHHSLGRLLQDFVSKSRAKRSRECPDRDG